MMFWGTIVFVIVEALLIFAMFRYRRRPNSPDPKHVHGNTALEITWTVLPMFILAIIAVPTVRQILETPGPRPGRARCRSRSSAINGGGSSVIRSTAS